MKNSKSIILISAIILCMLIIFMNYKFQTVEIVVDTMTLVMIEILFLIFGVLLIFIIVKIYNEKNFKPEKALLYITPIFCLIVSITIPVGRGHDEYMHWIKAYEVSEGTLFTIIKDSKSLANIPKSVSNVVVERTKGVFKYVDNLSVLDEKIDSKDRKLEINQNAATYCFVQYIPQAMGIAIGRIITKVPLLVSYFGRTFNTLVCILLMYFAIKNIPFGKNILLVLSIIPITIEAFATLSSDGITIAIACFFISYIFKIIFNKESKCGTKQIIILAVSGVILSLCKFVYLPIVFLVILIPKEKFKSRKQRIIGITIILLLAVILNMLWLYCGSQILVATDSTGTTSKFNIILTNPLGYLQKVIYTFVNNFNNYFLSCFGGQLEWNEMVKMDIVSYIMLGLSILAIISEEKLKNVFTKKQVIVIIFIILVIVGLIFTSIFLQWTTNKVEINGVQGRYFIPILSLILFLAGSIKINTTYKYENITKLICIVGYIVMLYTAMSIMTIHL